MTSRLSSMAGLAAVVLEACAPKGVAPATLPEVSPQHIAFEQGRIHPLLVRVGTLSDASDADGVPFPELAGTMHGDSHQWDEQGVIGASSLGKDGDINMGVVTETGAMAHYRFPATQEANSHEKPLAVSQTEGDGLLMVTTGQVIRGNLNEEDFTTEDLPFVAEKAAAVNGSVLVMSDKRELWHSSLPNQWQVIRWPNLSPVSLDSLSSYDIGLTDHSGSITLEISRNDPAGSVLTWRLDEGARWTPLGAPSDWSYKAEKDEDSCKTSKEGIFGPRTTCHYKFTVSHAGTVVGTFDEKNQQYGYLGEEDAGPDSWVMHTSSGQVGFKKESDGSWEMRREEAGFLIPHPEGWFVQELPDFGNFDGTVTTRFVPSSEK